VQLVLDKMFHDVIQYDKMGIWSVTLSQQRTKRICGDLTGTKW